MRPVEKMFRKILVEDEEARKRFVEIVGRFMGVFVTLGVDVDDIQKDLNPHG